MDHLVVVAASLPTGVAWVESALDFNLQPGGEHLTMATHNALLRLGETTYLEVISPNPTALPPGRPRWFGLDRLTGDSPPRLATWVARVADIRSILRACSYDFGSIEAMSRGRFKWLITIPPDGSLPGGGAIPTLIEWTVDDHPATGLQDPGCRLSHLDIFSTDSRYLSHMLGCLGLRDSVEVHRLPPGEAPYVEATIDTPHGSRQISGRPT